MLSSAVGRGVRWGYQPSGVLALSLLHQREVSAVSSFVLEGVYRMKALVLLCMVMAIACDDATKSVRLAMGRCN
jgi:hypothetical protein